MVKKKVPARIEDQELDQVSGGLPAVQKVREAATRLESSSSTTETSFQGGVSVAVGDFDG